MSAMGEPVRKVTSVVKADPRSGHLVRTVVVAPRAVVPKPVEPQAGDSVNPAPAQPPATSDKAVIRAIVDETARVHNVDSALIHSIVQVESNYNPYAVSHKGAEGLMQLMPSTARQLGVKNSFNPRENIEAGVRHYKRLREIFGDDRLALAAYNAGEGAVAKYKHQIPPYPETVNYVYKVGKRWGEARKQTAPAPAPAPVAANAPEPPPPPAHPKLEHFQDEQGRVFLRTVRP